MADIKLYQQLQEELSKQDVTLVAVSKKKSEQDILELYNLGHRDFGENYVQELCAKAENLPKDIRWHFIGHLQSNKVKYLAPFVHLIQSVDSLKLLQEINKQANKVGRTIDVLLQVYLGNEQTKFGLDETEVYALCETWEQNRSQYANVRICGMMGMATLTDDTVIIENEFSRFTQIFEVLRTRFFLDVPSFTIKSLGMSGDYKAAIAAGSNMVRIGSMLFGSRN